MQQSAVRRGVACCARCRRCRCRRHGRRAQSHFRRHLRRRMYRLPYPRISPTPANMPTQSLINIVITRLSIRSQQSRTRHNHPSLTIPALRNLRLQPSPLQRMRPIRRKPLNCKNLAFADGRNARRARPLRHPINMHGTSPAKSLPTPKLSPSKLKRIPQDPKQRSLRRNIHTQNRSINVQFVSSQNIPPKTPAKPRTSKFYTRNSNPQVAPVYPECTRRASPPASNDHRLKSNPRKIAVLRSQKHLPYRWRPAGSDEQPQN
jgi:hypothetical protein